MYLRASFLTSLTVLGVFLIPSVSLSEESPPPEALSTVKQQLPIFFNQVELNSVDQLREIQDRLTALASKMQAATVALQVGGAQGSGVIVSSVGHVLTAAHVVGEVGRSVSVVMADGRRFRGKVAGVDHAHDAAIVRIMARATWRYLPMADGDYPSAGDWLIAVGHPNGLEQERRAVVRLGRVIAESESIIQSDCSLVGGDSGGPLYDFHGRVVGIHSRIGVSNQFNFHVPIKIYTDDWEELNEGVTKEEHQRAQKKQPAPQKAYLGIRGRDATRGGCLITAVTPDGPAEKAGLKRGDVLVACDGNRVANFASLVKQLKKYEPGDELKVDVIRVREKISIDITLASSP